jgi:hypothetical protein
MSKYNYEDFVYVYVDPRELVDDTGIPVFECQVMEIESSTKASYGGEPSVQINYTLSLGWDDLYRKEGELFKTRKEAIQAGLSNYSSQIKLLENKLERYKKVYNLMEKELSEQ